MFKTIGSLATIILLGGCATPADIRMKIPDAEYKSAKDAKQVAICIADRWENSQLLGMLPVSMRPTNSGYALVIMINQPQINALADIFERPNNTSETKYYENAVVWNGWRKNVGDCQ